MAERTANEELSGLLRAAREHVGAVLHRPIRVGAAISARRPRELAGLALHEASIGGQSCVWLLVGENATPDAIASDVNRAVRELKTLVIAVLSRTTSANRLRLVQLAVPFIVAGSQVYIPQLALDLREVYARPVAVHRGGLTPATQLLLFHVLAREISEATPSRLAPDLEYTAMSVGRSFDELRVHGIGNVERRGREKILSFNAGPLEVMTRCRHLLRSPVRGFHAVRFEGPKPRMLVAGETALRAWTGARADAPPTFAIPAAGWQAFMSDNQVRDLPDIDGADAFIETWRYDPAILADGRKVDRLSLFAHFQGNSDPSLAAAADRLLKEAFE